MITKISQSFIKTMRAYVAGEECGNIVKAVYVDGQMIDYESESMDAGTYFEFITTGSKGKSGVEPQPAYMPSATKGKDPSTWSYEHMTANYRKAYINGVRTKKMLEDIGFKILHINHVITYGRFVGDLDLIVELTRDFGKYKKGDRLVIDLKYSGLLYDKWNKHGWMWSDIQKEYHGTQARQYHHISQKLPFMFLVVGSSNKEIDGDKLNFEATDMKFFDVEFEEWMIEKHVEEGNRLFDQFTTYAEIGFVARPEYSKCNKCPLKEKCNEKHTYPRPSIIQLV